ncbi:RicAFT regulatory complex protein RicA family protein [Listeria grandensis]|uniref:RicAFT regulatory complex protein RicA family protein n=1 Tax=Listeria grandensis TaxID=1494963 RepID=UPI0026A20456
MKEVPILTYQKEDIIAKARELKDALQKTEAVEFYRAAEAKINTNQKVAAKVGDIKKLQKEAVNLEHYQKFGAVKKTENDIDALTAEIDHLPIVQEFRRSQEEANDLLQSITREISDKVTSELQK